MVAPLRRVPSVRFGVAGRWRPRWPRVGGSGVGARPLLSGCSPAQAGRDGVGCPRRGGGGNPDPVPGGGAAAALRGRRRLRCVRVPAGLRRRGEPAWGGGGRRRLRRVPASAAARALYPPFLLPRPPAWGLPWAGASGRRSFFLLARVGGGGRALAARGSWEPGAVSRVGRGGRTPPSLAARAGGGWGLGEKEESPLTPTHLPTR